MATSNTVLEKREFNVDISVEKRNGKTSRKVTIRAAVFNSLSKPLGGFKEKIIPGAFDGADISDVVAVLNHDFNVLYARTASKTLVLKIDQVGLTAEFEAPNTSHGDNLLVMIDRGDIRHASFQFIVDKDRWILDPDQGEVRIIEKFKRIIDVSPVTFAAYSDTSVAKRSFDAFHGYMNHDDFMKLPTQLQHAQAEFELLLLRHKSRK